MPFERIEKLKQEYTDKYVVVDESRPELRRFRGTVGLVKTVNMSGRALVQFQDYHANTGWYDIELGYLKVVDKPEPKPAAAKEKHAAPAAEKAAPAAAAGAAKKLSPAEILAAARAKSGATGDKPAAAPAAKKPSTADILAAARAKAGAPPVAPTEDKPAAEAPASQEKPAAEEQPAPAPAPPVAPTPGKKLSVAEILAAARKKPQ